MSAAVRTPEQFSGKPSILVVEDEALIRMVVADRLEQSGFNVVEAGTADCAVTILETDPTIDLVFSDVSMPGSMDGFALAQWVRSNRPGVQVLLTSGDTRNFQAMRDRPANEQFFAKPYDLANVVACMRSAIRSRSTD